jgi:ribonucleotide reductase alpha subunit
VGQNECFEPFTSNIYTRKTLAGEFLVVNKHLMRRLNEAGMWDDAMRREILAAGGSIQGISRIPEPVRRLHRTAREMHPSLTIRTVKAMAPFVCQSLSMNLFLDEPSLPKILRFLTEGWRAGLKTGMYYCHVKPAASSQKTSVVDVGAPAPAREEAAPKKQWTCSEEVCTSCAL